MGILQRVNLALFHICLFSTISVISFVAVFGSSTSIKQALQRSGVYGHFVDAVIDESKVSNQNSSLHLDDPDIRKIVNKSFSASLMQSSTETAIDGIYSWLDGRHQGIKFMVDLRPAKQNLGNSISSYAFNRVRNLPFCKTVSLNYDPFTTDCQIPLVNIASEQKKVADTLANSPDLLPETIITDNNLPKTSDGQRLDTALHYVPGLFKWINALPYLLGGVTALLGLMLVRLQRQHRKALRALAGAMASDGLFLGFSTIIFGKVLPVVAPALSIRLQGGGVQALLDRPVQIISDQIENTVLFCCFVLLATAACMTLLEKGTRASSQYSGIAAKTGLAVAGRKPAKLLSNNNLKSASAPIQSSEQNGNRTAKQVSKKYRKINNREM